MIIFIDTSGIEHSIFVCNNTLNVTKNGLKKYEKYEVSIRGFTFRGLGVLSRPLAVTTDEDGE